MANKMVHLRIPATLYADSREIVKQLGFGSIQEFIKDSMRKTVQEYRKQVVLVRLAALKGSAKGIKRMTKEERNALALEFMSNPAERSKLLREFGFNK